MRVRSLAVGVLFGVVTSVTTPAVPTAVRVRTTEVQRQLSAERAYRAAAITEDSPGWDCRTMGNRICGEWNWITGTIENIYYPEGWTP